MKRLSTVIALILFAGAALLAHGGNEHLRGVVASIAPGAITLQLSATSTKTLTITAKTTFERSGKPARLADLKVGDRVVVDVPEDTTDALLVQIGAAAAPPAAAKAASVKLDIALTTQPKQLRMGENTFDVTVKDAAGQPLADADVSVVLNMPAMPAMNMPAMRNEVKLKSAGAGKYSGTGQVMMAGTWNVTVSVKKAGAELAEKKLSLTAR